MLKKYRIYISIFSIVIIFAFLYSVYFSESFAQISIIPKPKKAIFKNQEVVINNNWSIAVDTSNEQDLFTAEYLRQKLSDEFDLSLFIEGMPAQGTKKCIFLSNIDNSYIRKLAVQEEIKIPENINEEGYIFHSSPDKVFVIAKSSKGIFYGAQTLLQLISKKDGEFVLPEGDIEDYPDIKIRAVHFCGANPQEIKSQLEDIARLKFNTAIIDNWGFFDLNKGNNREMWQDIFEYARQLHIEPIPELQSFGAAGSLLIHDPYAAEGIWLKNAKFKFIHNIAVSLEPGKAPLINIIRTEESDILITSLDEKKVYKENEDYKVVNGDMSYPYSSDVRPSKILRILNGKIKSGEIVLVSYDYVVRKCSFAEWSIPYCPSSQRTYKIMDSAIKNTIETFGSKYIDIGHDEIRGMNRDSRCLERNLTNAQLLAEDINRLYSIANAYDPDIKLLMWSDMLNPWHNGGDENYQVQFGGKKGKTAPAIDFIPNDIIILLWNASKENLENGPAYFKSKGFAYWVNGTKWLQSVKSKSECAGIMVATWHGWSKSLKDIKKTAEAAW